MLVLGCFLVGGCFLFVVVVFGFGGGHCVFPLWFVAIWLLDVVGLLLGLRSTQWLGAKQNLMAWMARPAKSLRMIVVVSPWDFTNMCELSLEQPK